MLALLRGPSTSPLEGTLMHWVLIIAVPVVLLLLRWAVVRRRSRNASPQQGQVASDFKHAASLEARDWLLTGLGLLLVVALVYLFVSYVGPFKPMHEWFR